MPKKVTVFTRPTCAPCRSLKKYLKHKGINFNEVNVDESPEASRQMTRMGGGSMVPMTVITNQDDSQQVISGFNISRIASAIS